MVRRIGLRCLRFWISTGLALVHMCSWPFVWSILTCGENACASLLRKSGSVCVLHSFIHSSIHSHSFIHFVVCQTSGPKPLPKRILHRLKYSVSLKSERPSWCHLLFYFTSYVLNMFRTLIYQSLGTCTVLLNYNMGRFVLVSLCVGDLVRLDLSRVRVAGWSRGFQHTTNREQNDRCCNSTAQSQAPIDWYINVWNMLST